jgi:hypothetical protein
LRGSADIRAEIGIIPGVIEGEYEFEPITAEQIGEIVEIMADYGGNSVVHLVIGVVYLVFP